MSDFRHRFGLVVNCIAHPYRSLMRFSDWLVFDVMKVGSTFSGGGARATIIVRPSEELLDNSLDEFNERFRGNLHGVWDTAAAHEGTVCMTDVYVHFKPDGDGGYQFGLREQGLFRWRQKGDFEIEVKKDDEPTWTLIEYSFLKNEGRVYLDLSPAEDSPDWTYGLVMGIPLSALGEMTP